MCLPVRSERWGEVVVVEKNNDRVLLIAELKNCSVEALRVITLRSAVRVMPFSALQRFGINNMDRTITLVFRSMLFSWAVHKYLSSFKREDFEIFSDFFADYFVFGSESANKSAVVAVNGSVDDALDGIKSAAQDAAWVTDARTGFGVASASGVFMPFSPKGVNLSYTEKYLARDDSSDRIWRGSYADLIAIRSESADKCLELPVWGVVRRPQYFDGLDEHFMRQLTSLGQDWLVVYEFYQALRDGHPPFTNLGSNAEGVLLALVQESKDFWERHPDAVMRDLAERLRPADTSVSQRIISFLHQAEGEVSISEIRRYFERSAHAVSDHTIRGRLSDLAASGAIVRVRPSVYIHPDWVDKRTYDFFISYSSKDVTTAGVVVQILEQAGYSVLAQFKDFSAGSNFVTEMQTGLERAGRFVALLSPAYFASKHCQAEWSAAYNRDPSGEQRYLVQFLIEEASLPPLARQIVYRSIVGLDGDARRIAVLEAVGKLLRPEVPNIRSPYDFELTAHQTVAASGGAMNTISVLPNRDPDDARKRLEAAREIAAGLIADLRGNLFQVARHYITELERYQNRLPLDAGESIYSADAALRNIRDDLERDIQHGIDDRFLSRARRLIEAHYGLRIYFPELFEFYEDVRQSRQTEPVPVEALGKLREAIDEHTPDVFEPSVGEAFANAVDVVPAAKAESNDALVEGGHPPVTSTLPPDPIANVDPVRAAQHAEMSMQNRIWALLRGVEKGGKALERIEKVSATYQKWIDPILDWLSKSN